jgi:hypothetical protein
MNELMEKILIALGIVAYCFTVWLEFKLCFWMSKRQTNRSYRERIDVCNRQETGTK